MHGPDDERRADPRPAVVIYRAPLFNASETFVRAHPLQLERYRPLLAGLEDKGNIPSTLTGATFLPRNGLERLEGRLGNLGWLAARVAPERPRLVHAHFGPDGLSTLDLARRLRVPLVTSLRGYDVSRSDRALLLSGRLSWMRYALGRRRLAREGRLFLAVSEALRARAIDRGFPAERTVTHYNGVDLAAFSPGDGHDDAIILHVGRLVEKKGTALLLRAFAQVHKTSTSARLVIVGEGPLRPSLERLARELEIGDSVRFLGAQPPTAVAEWMRRSAVLAAPSVTAHDGDAEGLPNVVVEAAAAGLPVVGSTHAGIPEAVEDGHSGFLVPEGDFAVLAARQSELLASRELRRAMGSAARALVEARFDRRVQAERLERLYDDLVRASEYPPLTPRRR